MTERETLQHRKRELNILKPSKEAKMISPGRMLKNFLPTFEFTTVPVIVSDTFITPDRMPVATSSDIFVIFFTLIIITTIYNNPYSFHFSLHSDYTG